jgi:hypothetical protein
MKWAERVSYWALIAMLAFAWFRMDQLFEIQRSAAVQMKATIQQLRAN